MADRENDFDPAVKLALEKRAGHRCCFPGCQRPTDGPSSEAVSRVSRTGMACHIVAASNGTSARRRNSLQPTPLTPVQLKSIENGVWLCYFHGKLVDTDETRFTVEMLRIWRSAGELRARIHHETGEYPAPGFAGLTDHPLAEEVVKLDRLGSENEEIGDALTACAAETIWGTDFTHQLRDVLIELARNAFIHGGARSVTVSIESHRIRLLEDGRAFEALSLASPELATGGSRAIAALMRLHGRHAMIAWHREGGVNHFTARRIRCAEDIEDSTHCYVRLKQVDTGAWERTKNCGVLYVLVPKYWSTSDAVRKGPTEAQLAASGKKLVLVVQKPAKSMVDVLVQRFPDASILEVPE